MPALLSVAVGVVTLGTTTALDWPAVMRISAAVAAGGIVGLLVTANWWAPALYTLLRRHWPNAANLFWHLCLDKPSPVLRRRVLMTSAGCVAFCLLVFAAWPEARPWALLGACLSVGTLLGYYGLKCCRNAGGKGKVYAAVAGYLLSLSANYLADATVRDRTGERLTHAIGMLEGIRADVTETKAEVQQAKAVTQETKAIVQKVERTTDALHVLLTSEPRPIAAPPVRLPGGNIHRRGPPPNIALTSRASLRNQLVEWAGQSGGAALALVGAPGVNTTDIARDLAARFDPEGSGLPQFREIWWLDLHPAGSAALLEDNLTRLLGDLGRVPSPEADVADLAHTIRAALAEGPPSLFIIDGLTDPSILASLLPHGACTALVTTNRTDLSPQLIPSWPVSSLTQDEAFELLTTQREDLRAAGNDPALQRIIAEADGNDLALELCAAYLARQSRPSPAELVDALGGGGGSANHPFNQQSLPRGVSGDAQPLASVLSAVWSDLPDGPELALLRCAAWCAPENIPLSLLEQAAGLGKGHAVAPAEVLARRSIVRLSRIGGDLTLSMSRPVQTVVRLAQDDASEPAALNTINALLDALFDIFKRPETTAEQLRDQGHTAARLAALPHAESIIATASLPMRIGELGANCTSLRSELAHWLPSIGQVAAAARHIDAAIAWGEGQSPRDQRILAIDYATRARIRLLRGDIPGAEADLQKSIAWAEAQTPRAERHLAMWHVVRAGIKQVRGDLPGAESDIQRSIEWGEAQSPRDEWNLAIDYASRTVIRMARGDLPGAESDIQKSIDWGEAQVPRDDRSLAAFYYFRATIRQMRGDLTNAETDIQKSIDWAESQQSRDEWGLSRCYTCRSLIRHARGDLPGAEADIQRSIDWEEAQAPRNEMSRATAYGSRAVIRQARGDLPGAEADLARTIQWYEAQAPRNGPGLAIWYSLRASVRQARGDLTGTESDLTQCIQLGESQDPRDQRSRAINYASRAIVRRDLKLFSGALADVDAALAWWLDNSPDDDWVGILRGLRSAIEQTEK